MDKILTDVQSSGMVETLFHEDGKTYLKYEHDAEAAFEAVRQTRDHKDVFAEGMKKDMVHAFHIPVGVYMELRAIGVDVYTNNVKDIVRGLKQINRYDACRLTNRTFA
jgi:hypothetical protein